MSTVHTAIPTKSGRRPHERASWPQRHPVLAFFAVTYTTSWVYWVIALGAFGQHSLWWIAPGVFGPPAAAVTVTALVDGRRGLRELGRRLLLWRVGIRWYVVGLVVLPTLVVLSYLFLPSGSDQIRDDGWLVVPLYLVFAAVVTIVGGGQEEVGWRGFALPRMQERWGPLRAALLLGALWGTWHLPLFVFVPDYNNSGHGFTSIAVMFALFVVAYALGLSVLFAWLSNSTRGSILFVMLVHGFTNAAWAFGPMTRAQSATFYLLSAALAVGAAVATHGRLGFRRSSL